ncbi:hypothetical protein KSS87_019829 [Heliosperma pusillum]|nr:hypothetical protein KSS87_019829 [Heliosperma pusillum]
MPRRMTTAKRTTPKKKMSKPTSSVGARKKNMTKKVDDVVESATDLEESEAEEGPDDGYSLGAREKLNPEAVELTTFSYDKSVIKQSNEEEAFQRRQEAQCNIDSGIGVRPDKWTGNGLEFAGIKVHGSGMRSVHTKLAIYEPANVKSGQYSSSIVSVEAGEGSSYSLIEAGWTVNPCLYNDTKVHFYLYRFDGNEFCVDTDCGEFVVQSSEFKIGDVLTPSEVGWNPQVFLEIYIAQNQTSGDWYLNVNSKRIGYWEQGGTRFRSLKEGATAIRIGGEVYTPKGWDTTPPMGTGVMKPGMKTRTCFDEGIKINADESGAGGYEPQNPEIVETRCFYVADAGSPKWFQGYGFFFGGKGGKDQYGCAYPSNTASFSPTVF